MEQIYTIPVNEAFEKQCGCPFCILENMLGENEQELILGASMMEPDVRRRTNEQGFCARHFASLETRSKKLALALICESHLAETKRAIEQASKSTKALDALNHSCYICSRVENNLSKMFDTAVLLWETDADFRAKLAHTEYFCLVHYARFLSLAKLRLNKKAYAQLCEAAGELEMRYFEKLSGDVSWFVKKFDYRYENEPWGDSKDSVTRTGTFLRGRE